MKLLSAPTRRLRIWQAQRLLRQVVWSPSVRAGLLDILETHGAFPVDTATTQRLFLQLVRQPSWTTNELATIAFPLRYRSERLRLPRPNRRVVLKELLEHAAATDEFRLELGYSYRWESDVIALFHPAWNATRALSLTRPTYGTDSVFSRRIYESALRHLAILRLVDAAPGTLYARALLSLAPDWDGPVEELAAVATGICAARTAVSGTSEATLTVQAAGPVVVSRKVRCFATASAALNTCSPI